MPLMSLSSHGGGSGHLMAALHAPLQVRLVFLHAFLHCLPVLPSSLHSASPSTHASNSVLQLPMHSSKSSAATASGAGCCRVVAAVAAAVPECAGFGGMHRQLQDRV